MKFIKGRRKDFKTEDAYLKDIFEKNKSTITAAYGVKAEERFINQVKAYKNINGGTIKSALKSIERSRKFTPYEQLAGENIKQQLTKFGKWKQFQYMTRDYKGRFTSYDPNLLKYDRDSNSYIYAGILRIVFDNSPETITLAKI